ncbi:MAG: phosphatidylglycerophosphatase A [Calditrichia bacterium]
MRIFNYIVATGLGSGYSPVAPGTAGSILAALLIYRLSPLPFLWLLGSLFFLFLLGMYSAHQVEKELGKDPSKVVVDEMVGMGVSLLGVPQNGYLFLAAFVLFRFFDISKPPPIRATEKLGGGAGIMLDDLVAGVYALIGVHFIRWLFFPG